MDQCRLCLKQEKLCRSHIIPEFMYKDLYEQISEHNRCYLEIDASELEVKGKKQIGQRERLLCGSCEEKISKWEDYTRRAIYGGKLRKDEISPKSTKLDSERILIEDLDYKSFRLFQLSLLWRASVSSLDFFDRVSLGPHEEVVRKMLLSSETGIHTQYGCVMIGIQKDNAPWKEIIAKPQECRYQGSRFYQFLAAGFLWMFFVSSSTDPAPSDWVEGFLLPEGKMTILKTDLDKDKKMKDHILKCIRGKKL